MKWIHYSKYTGEDLGIDADKLLQALADFLLQSGFQSQSMGFSEWDEHTLENLKDAIRQALENGKLFDDEALQEMMEQLQSMSAEQVEHLVDRLIQKMVDEGQITVEEPGQPQAPGPGAGNAPETRVRFEVTDKSLDFLGYKALKGSARFARQVQLRAARYQGSRHGLSLIHISQPARLARSRPRSHHPARDGLLPSAS